MSLVSEALRKARRQSGDGERPGPGASLPATLVLPPHRPRTGTAVGTVVLVALLAGLAGAAGVWWLVGRHRVETPARQAAAVPAGEAPGATVPTAAPTAPPTSGDRTSEAARPLAAEPAAVARTAPAEPPESQRDEPAATSERPRDLGPRERSFLIDADLGYAKLHLDYLVYRPGSPFGKVNGQDVIVGTTVAGFMVEEITADYVKLADKRHTVILRVR